MTSNESALSGPGPGDSHHPATLWTLYCCFFISGIAGLIYEVVWSRYLSLFLGGTGQAHAIILATYMGGLALGAHLFGKRADRTPNPLRLYVLLEVGIGLLGLLYPRLFEPVRQLFLALVRSLGLHPVVMSGAAVLTCALSILLPTTLMGGTLPVLSRFLITRRHTIGQRIARLYYVNSLGAVFGSLLAGFWLLRAMGLEMSLITAALLNFAAAGIVRLIELAESRNPRAAASFAASPEPEPAPLPKPSAPVCPADPGRMWTPARIALIVIALSGFTSMVYEVAWIRLLTLVLGSASTSFSLMLAAFITGITLGSFLLSLKKTDHGYYAILGWCELAIGMTVLLSMLICQRLPADFFRFRTWLVSADYTFPVYQCGVMVLCFAVMLGPTIFMGAALPAASRVVADELREVGRRIGNVYAINTLGTLAGAALTGFWLLPRLGIRRVIEAPVAINLLLGLLVLATVPRAERRRWSGGLLPVGVTLLVVALYACVMPQWDSRLLSAGLFRFRQRTFNPDDIPRLLGNRHTLYAKDGTDATIMVYSTQDEQTGKTDRYLTINGKTDASDGGDMNTQMMIGHLPMMIHPRPEDVLVVGLGSGVTAGVAMLHEPRHVDCVELIPEVVEAAQHFRHVNHDVLNRKNFTLHLQDAKTFLQVTPRQYDVIINEPTNPWIVGVAGLFSKEYYEMCRTRLRPGGFFVQWIQCYELQDLALYSMLNTFNEYFPYSTMFNFCSGDIALVGSLEPFSPDYARMEAALARPAVRADLTSRGIHHLLAILSMQMTAKTDNPAPYVTLGGINSDFFPWLEYEAIRGVFIGTSADGIKAIDRRGWAPGRTGLWLESYRPAQKPGEQVFIDFDRHLARYGGLFTGMRANWCNLWANHYPGSPALRLRRIELNHDANLARARMLEDLATSSSTEALRLQITLLRGEYEQQRGVTCLPDATRLCEALSAALAVFPTTEQAGLRKNLGDLELDRRNPGEALRHYRTGLQALDALVSAAAGKGKAGNKEPAERQGQRLELMLGCAEALIDQGQAREAQETLQAIRNIKNTGPVYAMLNLLECRLAQRTAPTVPPRIALASGPVGNY